MKTFESLFRDATGYEPYPYQVAVATTGTLPSVLSVPTGMGKTAAVLMAWLWRRRFGPVASHAR